MGAVLFGLSVALNATAADAQPPVKRDMIVATTTSTQDAGLMDLLIPAFERESGYRIKLIAVGTGQALAMGARGDADVVLCHAPELERKYVAAGVFVNRRLVMYNDFVLVGPPTDPLKIRAMRHLGGAFRRIAEAQATFVSRGDQSGTHVRELSQWERVGIKPAGVWYLQTGQGQGATLNVASEKRAYALSDRGTFLALRKHLDLQIVFERAGPLLNLYHVMELDPARHRTVNLLGGNAFAAFLVSDAVQKLIAQYGVDKFGQPLFFPAAGRSEDQIGILGN